jgi:cobalt-zinc-cadmium efflux system membrane fusion protein
MSSRTSLPPAFQFFRPVFLLLLLLINIACNKPHEPETAQAAKQPPKYFSATEDNLKYLKVATVERSSGGASIALNGRVTFDEEHTAQVGSPVEGRITRVMAKPGDTVHRGQPLLKLHSAVFTLTESAEEKARSALRLAEKNLARAQRLLTDGAASQREVIEAEDVLAQARAEYARATADLASLGGQEAKYSAEFELKAPISGVIVSRAPAVALGAEVQPGSGSLFTIADLSQVWVLADLPEREMAGVQKGLPVDVEAQAYPGMRFSGTVSYVSELLDQTTRTAKLRSAVPNERHFLKPEMFVRVTLHRPSTDLLIPTSSVVTKGDAFYVYVEDDDKPRAYTPRVVILGPETGSYVPVIKGLNGGERIVVEGAILLDTAFHKLL